MLRCILIYLIFEDEGLPGDLVGLFILFSRFYLRNSFPSHTVARQTLLGFQTVTI